jgi:hypothetical protein
MTGAAMVGVIPGTVKAIAREILPTAAETCYTFRAGLASGTRGFDSLRLDSL